MKSISKLTRLKRMLFNKTRQYNIQILYKWQWNLYQNSQDWKECYLIRQDNTIYKFYINDNEIYIKRMLFNKTRQYKIQIFYKTIFFKYRTEQIKLTGRKEGNILFNDTLNTFYLRLYGVGHMVKDHSDSERENPLPPHRLLFPISSKGSFICTIP